METPSYAALRAALASVKHDALVYGKLMLLALWVDEPNSV